MRRSGRSCGFMAMSSAMARFQRPTAIQMVACIDRLQRTARPASAQTLGKGGFRILEPVLSNKGKTANARGFCAVHAAHMRCRLLKLAAQDCCVTQQNCAIAGHFSHRLQPLQSGQRTLSIVHAKLRPRHQFENFRIVRTFFERSHQVDPRRTIVMRGICRPGASELLQGIRPACFEEKRTDERNGQPFQHIHAYAIDSRAELSV